MNMQGENSKHAERSEEPRFQEASTRLYNVLQVPKLVLSISAPLEVIPVLP